MRKNNAKLIIATILLALVCIGGAELVACRYFDPPLYGKITEPAVQTAQALGNVLKNIGNEIKGTAVFVFSRVKSSAVNVYGGVREFFDPTVTFEPVDLTGPVLPGLQVGSSLLPITAIPAIIPYDTRIIKIDGREFLTGGPVDIVYFNQSDDAWRDKSFGYDNIGKYGCGPTAMAMVVATLTDTDTNPEIMARWAFENNYWASLSGSYHSLIPGAGEAFGLKVESLTERTPEALREQLDSGKIIVALMNPGHFTESGHFILLYAALPNGNVLVADPNSRLRSLIQWDPQLILDELPDGAGAGGPLWIVSVPED